MRKIVVFLVSFLIATIPAFANSEEAISVGGGDTIADVIENDVTEEDITEEVSPETQEVFVEETISDISEESTEEISSDSDETLESEGVVPDEDAEEAIPTVEDTGSYEDIEDSEEEFFIEEDFIGESIDERLLIHIEEALDYYYSSDDEVVFIVQFKIPVEYTDFLGLEDVSFTEKNGFIESIIRDWENEPEIEELCDISTAAYEEPAKEANTLEEVVFEETVEESSDHPVKEVHNASTRLNEAPVKTEKTPEPPVAPANESPVGENGVLILGALAIIIRFIA